MWEGQVATTLGHVVVGRWTDHSGTARLCTHTQMVNYFSITLNIIEQWITMFEITLSSGYQRSITTSSRYQCSISKYDWYQCSRYQSSAVIKVPDINVLLISMFVISKYGYLISKYGRYQCSWYQSMGTWYQSTVDTKVHDIIVVLISMFVITLYYWYQSSW